MKVCVECESREVYSVEFRTDYALPRYLDPVNKDIAEIDDEELPYRLEGHYCHGCNSLVSVEEVKIK
jgi:hypothetical protein